MIDAIIALICFTIYLVKTKYDTNNIGKNEFKEIELENPVTSYYNDTEGQI